MPSALYLEDAANDEPTLVNWVNAGDRFLKAFDSTQDSLIKAGALQKANIAFGKAIALDSSSLDAKTAKLDKKLKMIELQLKKQAIDQKANPSSDGDVVNGDGYVVTDRNSLLEKLKNMDK